MANKIEISSLTSRQKVTAIVFALILIVVIWQVIGLFKSSDVTTPATGTPASMTAKAPTPNAPGTPPGTPAATAAASNQGLTPQATSVSPTMGMSAREQEMYRQQQETQARYIAAINELQMLKVTKDIAETNQAIATAKLSTIQSEKKIVDTLTPAAPPPPPSPASYAQNLTNAQMGSVSTIVQPQQTAVSYSVISVTQMEGRWGAVVGYQGNLYNVGIGDLLPADGAKVVSINKSGVVLEKDGQRQKISLVPII